MALGYGDVARVEHGNTFSRSVANVGKLGFYPTDPQHCRKIAEMLHWPEGEVNALDNSIGNGVALRTVIAGADKEKVHTYGVELNVDIYKDLKSHMKEMKIDYLLNADFLKGVKISNNKFSFCFSNPPYGDGEGGVRLEQLFVEKTFGYMKSKGLLVLVIPYYLLADDKFVRSFYGRFEPQAVYRFDDEEYQKFKQIVIFARRRQCTGFLRDNLINWLGYYREIEMVPYLSQAEETYNVPISADNIDYFTTKEFNADAFREALLSSSLMSMVGKACIKPYTAVDAGNPPIPLSNETSHLVAVCGVGSGFAGNEEDGNLHLQRGLVEVKEVETVKENDNGDKSIVEVTRSSVTKMNIIDSNFNYICLEGAETVVTSDSDNEDEED